MLWKKIRERSGFVTTSVFKTKINEVENRIPDHAKDILTQESNKLTSEKLAARSVQDNLVSKTDFDNKLISFNRKMVSNKTKYLEVLKN